MNRLFAALFLASLLASSLHAADDSTPLENALRGVCRINQGNTSGTAFIVAVKDELDRTRHFVVTAAHVFDSFPEPECRLMLREKKDDGNYERRATSVKIRGDNKPLWTRHPDLDIAALPIELPEKVDVLPFSLDQIAEEKLAAEKKLRVGSEVWIPCFPAQLEANGAGWPITRKGTIASHPLAPLAAARTIMVDYSHFGGDSGAPIVAIVENKPVVIALTFAMARQSDRTVTPFEERTVHMPLGIALAIQSPYIRETIEKASQP